MLLSEDNNYPSESLLVHEFAHSVMNLGFYGEPELKAIELAYQDAKRRKLYNKDAYVSANSEEYFAECSQAWFDATIREDATDGVNTREKLKKRDPLMATIMVAVWGDNSWRYPQTAPAEFSHKRSRAAVETGDKDAAAVYGETVAPPKKKKTGGLLARVFKSPKRRSKRLNNSTESGN